MDRTTKVLIVCADARLSEPATEVLLRGGFVVDQAVDAPSALQASRAHRAPDIVLVDATTADASLAGFLDRLSEEFSVAPPKTVLLAGHQTAESLWKHPSVVYVVDTPAAVRSLAAMADWLGERDPHTRPSLVLKPLLRTPGKSYDASRYAS